MAPTGGGKNNASNHAGPFRRESDMGNLDVLIEQQKEGQRQLDEIRRKRGLGKGDKIDLKPDDKGSDDGDIEIDMV